MVTQTKRYSWYPGSRRPRNRLRKRKNKADQLGAYRLRKYYYSSTENNDKHTILDSGFTIGETRGALDKAWIGYIIAKKLENYADMKLYASIIQKLEKELKIEVNDFPELGLCACNLEDNETEENQDEDDSRLAVIDPWTNEKIQEAKEDKDDYVEVDFDSL